MSDEQLLAKLENEPEESDMPTDLSMSSMSQSVPVYMHQQEPPRPLSLHDPPAKFRSHAYNLMKTNQDQQQQQQQQQQQSQQQHHQSQQQSTSLQEDRK